MGGEKNHIFYSRDTGNIWISYLVGGAITILKNMLVNGKDDIPYMMENKKCSKPPSRLLVGEYPLLWNMGLKLGITNILELINACQ